MALFRNSSPTQQTQFQAYLILGFTRRLRFKTVLRILWYLPLPLPAEP